MFLAIKSKMTVESSRFRLPLGFAVDRLEESVESRPDGVFQPANLKD
jgi:hypothetical protein